MEYLTYHIASGRHSAVPVWYVHHGCRAGEAGGRPDAEHPAAAHLFHDQGRDLGTLITAVIQSSAGMVVICVGLVNSGIMTLSQSVGVIMGANIGTTVTGQLIRMADISGDSLLLTLMQPKTFAPVVAFVGCIFYVFLRGAKRKNLGQSRWVSASCSPV